MAPEQNANPGSGTLDMENYGNIIFKSWSCGKWTFQLNSNGDLQFFYNGNWYGTFLAAGQFLSTSGFAVGGAGPTWTKGAGAPASVQPKGSMYSRTDGAVGTTLYVSQGGGVWNAVAGV